MGQLSRCACYIRTLILLIWEKKENFSLQFSLVLSDSTVLWFYSNCSLEAIVFA